MSGMYDLRTLLKESIEEHIEYLIKSGDVLRTDADEIRERMMDDVHEIVDSCIPVYTSELMELAKEDVSLASEEPKIYGFSGEHTPVNGIVGNLYAKMLEWAGEILEKVVKELEVEVDE